jgi:glutamate-1-semialdehyde 2,1-aminomutase
MSATAATQPKTNSQFERSRALYERGKRVLAGGVSSQFRAFNVPHPMFYDRASGSRVWDVDGNELIDYTLSQGPCILGHSNPELIKRVTAAFSRGQLFAGQHEDELALAETLHRLIPSADLVRFTSSGSEAAHALLRLARHVTGRPKFIKFIGHYHGWFDNVSFSVAPPASTLNDPTHPVVWGGGIPPELADDVVTLPWNDIDLVRDVLKRQSHEIGAIITEPVMCNQGCIEPRPGYLQGLRDLADEFDVALIFDEIITGFRIDLSGAQGYYDVTPDMAMFGKALGSGLPLAAIVGKERFMSPLSRNEVTHAGTMNGNNACIAAGLATIHILERNNKAAHRHLAALGKELRDGLTRIAARSAMPILVQGPGPMFHMGFTRRTSVSAYHDVLDYERARYQEFSQRMLERGIRLIERGLWYISAAHSADDVEITLETAQSVLTEMAAAE